MCRTKLIITAACALLLAAPLAQAQKLYKLYDAEGNVFYSDRVPPEYSRKARDEMNDQGMVVRKVDAPPTEEELARIEREQREAEARSERLAKERARQEEEERTLLRTYSHEDEIIQALNSKLEGVDVLIDMSRGNLSNLGKRLLILQKRAADLELVGRKPDEKLLAEIAETQASLDQEKAFISEKEGEKEQFKSDFMGERERFLEIKQRRLQAEAEAQADGKEQKAEGSVSVNCANPTMCDRAWSLAQLYVREFATTRFQVVTDTIILTQEPKGDTDLGMSISRMPGEDGQAELFLDVQCADTPVGDEYCRGEDAGTVRNGFAEYIKSRL